MVFLQCFFFNVYAQAALPSAVSQFLVNRILPLLLLFFSLFVLGPLFWGPFLPLLAKVPRLVALLCLLDCSLEKFT